MRDGLPYPYTEQDARAYISAMLQAAPNFTYAFAITSDDKAFGSIGTFLQGNIHTRTAEMGYYIAEPFGGQAMGTSAVQQTCAYVFEQPISFGALRSLLPSIQRPAMFSKRAISSVRAF